MKWQESQAGFYFKSKDDPRIQQVLNSKTVTDTAIQSQSMPTGYKDYWVVAVEFNDKSQVDSLIEELAFDDSVEIERG